MTDEAVPMTTPEEATGRDQPLPLVSRFQAAAVLGVHHVTIAKLEREGLPVAERGKGGRASKYDLAQVVPWYLARERGQLEEQYGALSLEQQRAGLADAQRRKTELEIKAREGELMPRPDVRRIWSQRVTSVRARLVMLAATAVQRGIVPPAKEQALQDLVEEAMRELAGEGAA